MTYYLAKQPEGIFAYEEDLCDGSFLDLKRHVSRRMTVIKEAHIDFSGGFANACLACGDPRRETSSLRRRATPTTAT